MSRVFEIPAGMPIIRYEQSQVRAFKEGQGWDAKDPISNLELVHKPAFILVVNNQAVIDDNNKKIDDAIYITDKFILQSMTENRTEKVQIMETFGDAAISFFDMKTKVYQISGTLLEANGGPKTNYYKWASMFKDFYEKHFRGTQLARQKKIAVLSVMDNLIYFYPLNLNVSVVSAAPYSVVFNMNILVTKHNLTANNDSPLNNQYKFYLTLEQDLGIPEAIKEEEEATIKLNTAMANGPANTVAKLWGIRAGLLSKIYFLNQKYIELTSKYAEAYIKGNKDEISTLMILDIQAATDEADDIQTRDTNEAEKSYRIATTEPV